MDLTKRLAVPVELMVNEVRTIVQNRVEQGGSHGLRVLMGDLDGDFWVKAKTRADGLPDVQWKASADRYSVENLSDGEVDSVLAARLAKTSPAVAGIARNVVTMLEEANSLLSCLSPEDRDGVNTLFSKGSGLDGQLQSSLAAARLVARVAEYRQEHALGRFETVEEAKQAAKGKEQPAVVTREQARFMGFNTDTALGKYTAIVKLEEGMSDRDARSDAISMMRASFGGFSAVRVGDEARLLAEIPEGAWEDKNCLGWGWMMKGHLPELVAEKQFPQSPKFLFITIDNAQTAAFADIGRNNEVRRILNEAADRVLAHGLGNGFDLHDVNGNVIGRVEPHTDSMIEPLELPPGGIRVVLDLSSAAFDDGINRDVDIAAAIDMAAKRFDVPGAGTHFLLVSQEGVVMGAVGQSLPDDPERAPAADDSHLAL